MKNRDLIERFVEILNKNEFYYDIEELNYFIGERHPIELTGKSYGDSYERYIDDVFSKDDLNELRDLAKQLKIRLPEFVYFD